MKYSLWIDDVRNPGEATGLINDFNGVLLWARDPEQAMYYVKLYGLPVTMYLDHDLGEVTVMLFLKWLADNYFDQVPGYMIISDNPDGIKNITSFMESWRKSNEM